MKTLFLTVALLSVSLSVHAVPNVWGSTWGNGGYIVYHINDEKGNYLRVICTTGGTEGSDHDVHFEFRNGKTIENTQVRQPLSFLFNKRTSATTWGETGSRTGAGMWSEFSKEISRARLIEVFVNERKVATFKPNIHSIRKEASAIAECQPMLWNH